MMINYENVAILLVEDNIINQKVALRILEKFGFHADAVVNGKEAIDVLEKTKYDLILMDIQMPEMDGIEAVKIIRDSNSNVLDHEVPIVAVTAHAMKGDRERCLDAGMDDYVTKPINPNKLKEAIDQQLSANSTNKSEVNPTKPSIDEEIFSQIELLERFDGDKEFASEIVDVFLEDFNLQKEQLEQALINNDAETVERIAHSIKGACLNVCAPQLSDVASAIEIIGKKKELNNVDPLVSKLEADFQKFRAVLFNSGLVHDR